VYIFFDSFQKGLLAVELKSDESGEYTPDICQAARYARLGVQS